LGFGFWVLGFGFWVFGFWFLVFGFGFGFRFITGLVQESVRRALRRSGDREDRAINLLLEGLVADAADDAPLDLLDR
jgi:hypothetical protein